MAKAKQEMIWIQHVYTKQTKEMKVKDAKEFLESPSWIEVEMTPKGPMPVSRRDKKALEEANEADTKKK